MTISYYNFFKNIVDELRLTGDVIDLTDNNDNTYTFETNNASRLELSKWIALGTITGIIIGMIGNAITIRSMSGQTTTGINSFKRLDPFFNADIQQRTALHLTMKDTDYDYSTQKFPLIELVLNDIESEDTYYEKANYKNFNIVISVDTCENWTGDQRLVNNFDAILYPLYKRFAKLLYESPYVLKPNEIKIDRKDIFLASYQYKQNSKNNFVDAIDLNIRNLTLNFNYTCKYEL